MGYALRDAPLNDADHKPGLPALRSSGGDRGGGMTENIEPRVRKLENDVAVISHNLAVLTVRSESFATHADVANVRTEMATMRGELTERMTFMGGEFKGEFISLRGEMALMRGELKEEMASLRGELKEDMASLRGELKDNMSSLRGELKEEIASLRGELKGDIVSLQGELKEDMAASKGELKEDMASLKGELKGDIVSLRGEIHETLQKAINKQTVLLLTIIPATLAAIAAVAAWFK